MSLQPANPEHSTSATCALVCDGCGEEASASWKFCPGCGAGVTQAETLAEALPTDTDWDDEIERLLAEPMPELLARPPAETPETQPPRVSVETPEPKLAVANPFADDPLLADDPTFADDTAVSFEVLGDTPEEAAAGYRPIWNLGRRAQFGALSVGVLAVANIAGLTYLNKELESVGAAMQSGVEPSAGRSAGGAISTVERIVNYGLQPLLALAALCTLVFLIRVCRQAYVNLEIFRVGGLRWGAQSSTLALLTPGINVIAAKFILDEIWAAARPYSEHDSGWRRRRHNPWILAWWVLLISALSLLALYAPGSVAGIEASIDTNRWIAIAFAILGLAMVALVPGLAAIGHRDAVHAETLGLASAAEVPRPDPITTMGLRSGAGKPIGV